MKVYTSKSLKKNTFTLNLFSESKLLFTQSKVCCFCCYSLYVSDCKNAISIVINRLYKYLTVEYKY